MTHETIIKLEYFPNTAAVYFRCRGSRELVLQCRWNGWKFYVSPQQWATLVACFRLHLWTFCVSGKIHLHQLLLGILQPAELALGALSQVPQSVSLHLGLGDLILHLLLQVLLLHCHRAVLLLSLLQAEATDRSELCPLTIFTETLSFCLHAPALQVKEALLSVLQALQVLHHLGDVHFARLVLHVRKPTAADTDHDGDHQDKILHPVVLRTCRQISRG